MFDRAINGPLKDSLLIHFAYADFEEVREYCPKPHPTGLVNNISFRIEDTSCKGTILLC